MIEYAWEMSMTETQFDQVEKMIAERIGPDGSLYVACEWMTIEQAERGHCALKHDPLEGVEVPSVEARVPNMSEDAKSFSALVVKYVSTRFFGETSEVYKRAGITRSVYSRISTNVNHAVTKRTAVRMAFALRLTLPEAEELLAAAGYAFSEAIAEDVILKACLAAKPQVLDFADVDALLEKHEVDYRYSFVAYYNK